MATDLQIPYNSQVLTAQGGSNGRLTVGDTSAFRKGARVLLRDNTNPAIELIIDKIESATSMQVRDPAVTGACLKDCSAYVLTGMSAPVNGVFATATTGGSLVPGTYFYRVAAINYLGNSTAASTETSKVVPAGTNTNTVTVTWAAVAGAVKYKIYGRATGAELLIGTVEGATLSFVDDGSVTPAGALPGANGTTNSAVVVQNPQTDFYARTWNWF